jgi:glycosyltransferase involved in cell wall biosynthesis
MKILMIDRAPPYPPTAGDRQRSNLLFRALQQIGDTDLFLLCNSEDLGGDHEETLRRNFNLIGLNAPLQRGMHWPWAVARGVCPRGVDRLAHNLGRRSVDFRPDSGVAPIIAGLVKERKFDLVVGRYLLPTVKSGAFGLGIPVIVDVDDLDTQLYENRRNSPHIASWQKPILQRHIRQLNRLVPAWANRASHLWVSCSQDAGRLGHRSVSTLVNVPFYEVTQRLLQSERSCHSLQPVVLIVGSLGNRPNVSGVNWLIQNVWPDVLASVPHAALRIVGGGGNTEMVRKWAATTGVFPVGYAQDLSEEYKNAAVVAAPIFEGGGTKIKVLEALQHAKGAVVTPHALRGYSAILRHEQSLLVAEAPGEFASAIVSLLQAPDRAQELGRKGSTNVAAHFSHATFFDCVSQTIDMLRYRGLLKAV